MSLPSFVDAHKLLSDPYSSLTLQNLVLHVVLQPKYVGNKKEGITEFLDWKMGIYNVQFDGVLIAYSNIKTICAKGTIITDKPYIHYDITGDFIIFRPTYGSIIRGSLNTLNTSDYLSCIVHKSFNVSIPLNGIIIQHELKVNDKILFVVKNIQNHKGILSMMGKLSNDSFSLIKNRKRKLSEISDFSKQNGNASPTKLIPMKKIKIEKDTDDEEGMTLDLKQYMIPASPIKTPKKLSNGELPSTPKKNSEKKKKRKSAIQENSEDDEISRTIKIERSSDEENVTSSQSKKKRKSKKLDKDNM